MQARHEFKHSLNYGDYVILRSRLGHVMARDPHGDEKGEYRVRSLYFDTPGDKALREKIDGADKREKFRIRRYLGNTDYIRLEKKSKVHGMCCKQSIKILAEEVTALQNGDLTWMAEDHRELIRELYTKMRSQQLKPKTLVDYIREPFICTAGNVRITFDRDIRTGLFSTDFMKDNLPTIKAGDEIVLLEVKYDQFIPEHIVKVLQLEARRASAVSKYALCRMYG
ncbi:polyphosphate polymerase domain-containing protein [Anaerocolumna aminovalerica]|uniref:polyphosphate polymerase domain-containing protein n=1 Tax=Anaerocolumna aminovalerica TaxID=1527 RepID=UPI001C0F0C3D|nr:polyphosphate polymerase domain-containing protein [Anaerocolumna aminovalerica]MBU5333095.1 polyphosphate polymerase domain-containing protein [Anaerocolumna aminovalerica]